jgi:hypothetical protein
MNTEFQTALDKLPDGTGFDAYVHKTVEDLCWICLHELDLHAEAEYFVPMSLRKKYLAFNRKWGFYHKEAQAVFDAGKSISKADCYTQ